MFSRGIEQKLQSQIHKLKESQPVVCRNKKTALPFTAPMVCSGVAVVEIDREVSGLLQSMSGGQVVVDQQPMAWSSSLDDRR